MKTCCFSGHRPERFPWGTDEKNSRCIRLKNLLKKEISRALRDGYTHFIVGGALGVDTWAAEILCALKADMPKEVVFEIALPFAGYNRPADTRERLRQEKIYAAADKITVVCERRSVQAYHARNRYMVDHSGRLIAVFEEDSGIRGGTFQTLRYARMKGIEVRQIGWISIESGKPRI